MTDGPAPSHFLERLETVIRQRRAAAAPDSYVARLDRDAPESICAKLVEEAYEVVEAVHADESERRAKLIHEAADVVFHLLVLLGWADIPWQTIVAELESRAAVRRQAGAEGDAT